MDIESLRAENLRQKQKLLAELNLHSKTTSSRRKAETTIKSESKPPPTKKRRLEIPLAPSRTSARLASGTRPSYKEDNGEKYNYIDQDEPKYRRAKGGIVKVKHEKAKTEIMNDMRSLVPAADVDSIRAGWTDWQPVGASPIRDEQSAFHFEDYPRFTPNKSPEEMLREGSFGGSYFRPLKSKRLGIIVEDDWKELPKSWLDGLDVDKYLTSPDYDPEANKFKVACGQSIEEWEAAGWIAHEYDIRGWFQWYCRFWMGRRCDDDDRQVSRWAKCVGPRGRWRRLLMKKYVRMGVKDVFDYGDDVDEDGEGGKEVSPVMHQTCHHWAFEVRQGDLDEAWEEFG